MELFNGYILIRVDAEETVRSSGIVLATSTVKLPSSGEIIEIDKTVDGLKVGDRVQFLRYASVDGIDQDTRFCTKDMIIAKLR